MTVSYYVPDTILCVYKHILLNVPNFIRYHFTDKETEARKVEKFACIIELIKAGLELKPKFGTPF